MCRRDNDYVDKIFVKILFTLALLIIFVFVIYQFLEVFQLY
jgi:hypothetical protein